MENLSILKHEIVRLVKPSGSFEEIFLLHEANTTCWMFSAWGGANAVVGRLKEISVENYTAIKERFEAEAERHAERVLVHKDKEVEVIMSEISEYMLHLTFRGVEISYFTPGTSVATFVASELEKYRAAENEKRAKEALKHKQYARECGRTARRLGINFVNVLRLGYEDENKLVAFQKAMERAKQLIEASPADLRSVLFHEIMECGRDRKKAALASLGVIVDADVNHMCFDELFA